MPQHYKDDISFYRGLCKSIKITLVRKVCMPYLTDEAKLNQLHGELLHILICGTQKTLEPPTNHYITHIHMHTHTQGHTETESHTHTEPQRPAETPPHILAWCYLVPVHCQLWLHYKTRLCVTEWLTTNMGHADKTGQMHVLGNKSQLKCLFSLSSSFSSRVNCRSKKQEFRTRKAVWCSSDSHNEDPSIDLHGAMDYHEYAWKHSYTTFSEQWRFQTWRPKSVKHWDCTKGFNCARDKCWCKLVTLCELSLRCKLQACFFLTLVCVCV